MSTLRDLVLGAVEAPSELVQVPALGVAIRVRGMTGRERDAFEASCFEGKGKKRAFSMKNVRAKLVAYCCIEEDGRRLFTDDDAERLGDIRADVLDRLFGVAQRLSGISEEDADELGQTSRTPSAISSSPSPVSST